MNIEALSQIAAQAAVSHALRPQHWTQYGKLPTVDELKQVIAEALRTHLANQPNTCCVCHQNYVNTDAGFDTCYQCSRCC